MNVPQTLDAVCALAKRIVPVGQTALAITQQEISVWEKDDKTVTTNIDVRIESEIRAVLAKLYPDVPILGEEGRKQQEGVPGDTCFILDPIDGTRQMLAEDPEWSISIALLENGVPSAGIIVQPLLDRTFCAYKGEGALTQRRIEQTHLYAWQHLRLKKVRKPRLGLDLATRIANSDAYWEINHRLIKKYGHPSNMPSVMSGVRVALGNSHLWHTANARVWDLAAVYVLVTEAGGVAECMDGSPIPWNEVHSPPVLFANSRETLQEAREAIGDLIYHNENSRSESKKPAYKA